MGALDGFYDTWSKAKDTFGVGTPTDGSQYDGSSKLMQMKAGIESAAPDDRWQGSGSDAYRAANKEHASVYEKLAELDKKMAAEVTKAANVVTTGRTNLDATKSWVESAVSSLPSGLTSQEREKSLIPIARKGVTQVNNTVQNANKDMLAIGQNINGLKGQFGELTNQKFAGRRQGENGEGDPPQDKAGDEKDPGDKPAEPGSKPGEPGGPEFVIGPPTKPEFNWDEDFEYDSRDPTFDDYAAAAKWKAMLNGGELLRPDLDDATAMYRHYWENNGKPQQFDYDEAYREDPSVRTAVDSEIARAAAAADALAQSGNSNFPITGDPMPVGDQLHPDPKYPYPQTENWQKTIGAYQQWSHSDVRVEGNRVTMEITVEAEDHYNFNRGSADIGSGAPDDENGRFTEVGWAKPFDTHGSVTRTISWELGHPPDAASLPDTSDPSRNPGREDRVDNRGATGPALPPQNDRTTGTAKPR